jgi:Zn-dependent protease
MSTTCAFHPKVETALSCSRCERPACPDCLTPAAVGQHCDGCTKGRPAADEAGGTAYKVRSVVVGVDEYQRLRRPGLAFFAVVGVFLACCVGAAVAEPLEYGATTSTARIAAMLVVVSGAVVGVMFHEWAHAIVAYRGGDRTVADKGYLTMDIRHYSDPLLSIGMPVLFLLLGGLPIPGGAVWINHHHLRSRWWDSAVSLAGPGINLLGALGIYALVSTGAFDDFYVLGSALAYLAYIEVAIVILNLIPIPGLDGYGAIEPFLPGGIRDALAPLRQFTFMLLLLFILSPASDFIWDWANTFETVIGFDIHYAAYGQDLSSPRIWGNER